MSVVTDNAKGYVACDHVIPLIVHHSRSGCINLQLFSKAIVISPDDFCCANFLDFVVNFSCYLITF